MPAPPIPAEQSIPVPNIPNVQNALSLWPDRDPNLHQTRIYEFEIEAAELKKILRATALPKWGAPFLIIEVSSSALKIISQAQDASFDISPSVPLPQCAKIGSDPIRFEVDRKLMTILMTNIVRGVFTDRLAFTFDRNLSSLAWSEKGGSGSYSIEARGVPLAASESGLRPLAVVAPQSLATGIRYVSALIDRKSPPDFPYEGIRIEGGSILGGYFAGFSRCRPLLPASLVLNVPKDHVANARALFGRMAGPVEILESDSRIHFRAHNIDGSWKRIDARPGSQNRIFERSPLQTVRVVTAFLQQETCFMAGLFEKLQVTIENHGAYGRVVLSGSSKIGRGMTRILEGMLVSNRADNPRPWDLTIDAEDLYDAASATTTPYTILGDLERGLLVQSEGSEDECKTILLGRERQ
jgi:hypothetical protein